MSRPQDVAVAIEDLERALETFRAAYSAWLDGTGDATALKRAIADAEERLDKARIALADADKQSYPS